MSYIKGKFKHIIFESESGYRVGLFKVNETDDENIPTNKLITYTGYFMKTNDNDNYVLNGKYIFHDRYGYQFSTDNYEKIVPEGKDAIIDFLTSSFVKGCGEVTAKKIYKVFGNDSLYKIKENKSNLELVEGINEKKREQIYNSVCKYFDNDALIVELKNMGFSVKETMNLINKFGKKIKDIINKNIYDLSDEINFKKLDEIFLSNNDMEDDRRVKACLIETMKYLTFSTGDIYLYKEEICAGLKKLYGINVDIDSQINYLFNISRVAIKEDKIYLKEDYDDEVYIADYLTKLFKLSSRVSNIDRYINKAEKVLDIKYNEEQKEAISKSLINNISVITGGPGTGKTTIIKGIIKTYSLIYKVSENVVKDHVLLLAPTGRAAKRMSESTGYQASTIHRFLKWDKENNVFNINELNSVHYNLIIVDESSMIDNHLMASLLRGLDIFNTQIVLVGDEYQLPSVGPGLVLNDIINTNIPHIRLEKIYRQSDKSYIPTVAKNIKDKVMEIVPSGDDFSFISCDNLNIKSIIIKLLDKMQEKGIDVRNVQVLAPMYKGENGIDNLNILLQEYFNPVVNKKDELKVGPITYRVGDKILNLVNDVDNNIFNGDIGYICSVNVNSKKDILSIDYDGNIVDYKREDLISISHAYAITIHKSQGSEFDYIIMPISLSYNRMLYNKLLYTGVSRAKKSLILVGSKDAYLKAINNDYSFKRKTTLNELIMNKV